MPHPLHCINHVPKHPHLRHLQPVQNPKPTSTDKLKKKTIELRKMDKERQAISAAIGSKSGMPSAACPLTCGPFEGVGAVQGGGSWFHSPIGAESSLYMRRREESGLLVRPAVGWPDVRVAG